MLLYFLPVLQLHYLLLILSSRLVLLIFLFFFLNDAAPTKFSPLPLPDALPICRSGCSWWPSCSSSTSSGTRAGTSTSRWRRCGATVPRSSRCACAAGSTRSGWRWSCWRRSEEHTSELQSQSNIVCRLLLEKKKK